MRVALCLSGHLRTFRDTFPSLEKHLLSTTPCDVFIHTWDEMGWFGPSDGDMTNRKVGDEIEEVKRMYRPVAVSVEPARAWPVPESHRKGMCVKEGTSGEHIYGMFYGVRSANELKSAHERAGSFRYAAVIRSRFDVLHYEPLRLRHFHVLPNSIYFDVSGHYSGVNDQFALSGSPQMDCYSKCFDNLDAYVGRGCQWRPESLLHWHLRANRIRVLCRPFKYHLLRSNGDVFRNVSTFGG